MAALGEEPLHALVGDGCSMALHRLDLNDPLKEDRDSGRLVSGWPRGSGPQLYHLAAPSPLQ